MRLAYSQRCVFKKFKDINDFLDMAKELGISRSTINFKINLTKLLDEYSRLKKNPHCCCNFPKIMQRAYKKYVKKVVANPSKNLYTFDIF